MRIFGDLLHIGVIQGYKALTYRIEESMDHAVNAGNVYGLICRLEPSNVKQYVVISVADNVLICLGFWWRSLVG